MSSFPRGFPRRGEIYLVDFDPARGSEQGGRRPAVVVSNDVNNQHSTIVIIAALTTKEAKSTWRFVVSLPADEPMAKAGTILCNQVMTLAKDRLGRHLATLSSEQLDEVSVALAVALGMT